MAKQAKTGNSYRIKPGYEGKDVWTPLPDYPRPDGAKFSLTSDLDQVDLAFLAEVVMYEGVEQVS